MEQKTKALSAECEAELKLRWIAERDEQWKEHIAQLERELAEMKSRYECDCKEVTAARIYLRDQNRLLTELAECKEGQAELELWRDGGILHDKFSQEIDALAAQVVQMKAELKNLRFNLANIP